MPELPSLFNYDNQNLLSQHPLGWSFYDKGSMSTPFIAGQVTDATDRITETATCDEVLAFGLVVVDSNAGVGGLGIKSDAYGSAIRIELPSAANTFFTGVVQHEHIDPVQGGLIANPPRTSQTITPSPIPGTPTAETNPAITPPPVASPSDQPPPGSGIITNPWQIGFPAKYPVPVLKRGRIAVQIDSDIKALTPTMPVFVRVADSANNIDKRGQCRPSNLDGSVQWEGVRWTGRIIPGKIAELSILLV